MTEYNSYKIYFPKKKMKFTTKEFTVKHCPTYN